MTANHLVSLDHVSKYFGDLCVVDHISFNVAAGEVLGVMGPNGTGKTTTMRMIAGFLQPSSGKININGFDVVDQSLRAKKNLGYLPEGAPLWQDMSVINLMHFAAQIRGFHAKAAEEAIDRAMLLADLYEVANQPISTLSKGYRRRVGLAQAIFHNPPILVLDEPTDGLDPNQKHHVRALIKTMAQTKAIIISTHILEELNPLCTRVLIMNQGKILADETPTAFAARSNYHHAVSVRVNRLDASKLVNACAHISNVRNHEISTKQNESQVVFFPRKGRRGEKIAQEISHIAEKHKITLHMIEIEAGRLDDAFYNITKNQ